MRAEWNTNAFQRAIIANRPEARLNDEPNSL